MGRWMSSKATGCNLPWQKHPPLGSLVRPFDPRAPSSRASSTRTVLLLGVAGPFPFPLEPLFCCCCFDGVGGRIRSETSELELDQGVSGGISKDGSMIGNAAATCGSEFPPPALVPIMLLTSVLHPYNMGSELDSRDGPCGTVRTSSITEKCATRVGFGR